MTRSSRDESTAARKRGQPVFVYGATPHGLPIWVYKYSMGNEVDKEDVLKTEGP